MSHVKFFDMLKTNRKEANYLLHRLANAVVGIDELQTYNPVSYTHLDVDKRQGMVCEYQ